MKFWTRQKLCDSPKSLHVLQCMGFQMGNIHYVHFLHCGYSTFILVASLTGVWNKTKLDEIGSATSSHDRIDHVVQKPVQKECGHHVNDRQLSFNNLSVSNTADFYSVLYEVAWLRVDFWQAFISSCELWCAFRKLEHYFSNLESGMTHSLFVFCIRPKCQNNHVGNSRRQI